MKSDDSKHQLKGWLCKVLLCTFLPLQNYYLKQLQSTLSESLLFIFCPLCFAITSWWLWREKSCWRRGWLVIVSSNANHDKSDPESNPPVSLLFCTFGVISIQRGIITMVKWLLPTYLLFYQKQLTKLFFCFFFETQLCIHV